MSGTELSFGGVLCVYVVVTQIYFQVPKPLQALVEHFQTFPPLPPASTSEIVAVVHKN